MIKLVIVGAGFSGVITAIQFMKYTTQKAEITLINRSLDMACGTAYSTDSPYHLLNVPAGNMSALVDEPNSFLEFCQRFDPLIKSTSFVCRSIYGAYLNSLLFLELKKFKSKIKLNLIVGNAISLKRENDKSFVLLESGDVFLADHVVLAFGNFPPYTQYIESGSEDQARYVADPWGVSVDEIVDDASRFLLIGTGLTAVDMAIAISSKSPDANIVLMSRRGLSPLSHSEAQVHENRKLLIIKNLVENAPTARGYLRIIRNEVSDFPGQWREAVAAVRPLTSELWQRLPLAEKKRFVRHLKPFWEVHRHRIAPVTYTGFESLLASAKADIVPARIYSVKPTEHGVNILFRRRGCDEIENDCFDKVVNCIGPCTDIFKIEDVFVSFLAQKKIISADALGLGINVDENYSVIDCDGCSLSWLSYIGPMLRARFWEATAVPELRVHAAKLAMRIAPR